MTAVLSSLQLFVVAGVAFWLLGAVLAAAAVLLLASSSRDWHPEVRHRVFTAIAVAPLVIGTRLLVTVSLPSLAALFAPGLDHCALHDDGHAHLCFRHLPTFAANVPLTLVLVFVGSCVLAQAALSLVTLFGGLRALRALFRSGTRDATLGITVLDTERPMGFAAGWLRPRVLVSRGLLEGLAREELAIVLANEHAHARRKDALLLGVVRVATAFQLPRVGRWLLREVALAAEQACDERAAMVSGDRLTVAETILRVERMVAGNTVFVNLAVGFGEGAVCRRVSALLEPPLPAPTLRPIYAATALVTISTLLLAGHLHPWTESLFGLVIH